MLTLEQLRRQVESAQDLHSITRAMKALSAVRIRQSRQAVDSLENYRRTVDLALQVAVRNRPRGVRLTEEKIGPAVGAVVFGSDLGLAGRFNIRISEFALEHLDRLHPKRGDRTVLAVGSRVGSQLQADGQPVVREFPSPDSAEAVVGTVQELLLAIQEARTKEAVDRFYLFYNHYLSGAQYRPRLVNLLPLDPSWLLAFEEEPWPTRVLPAHRVPWQQLFSELVREHLFVSLFAAAARSQAAENASRLASMEAAERRIDERLGDLRARFNHQRQERITAELLDLITGYLAIEEEDSDRG
jgi:F-type H+-transporting ATPase subunit gamma